MFNENQIVQIRWNNSNRDWYELKGYVYTKRNDFFNVVAKDLMPHSSKKVSVVCDYCGEEFNTQYAIRSCYQREKSYTEGLLLTLYWQKDKRGNKM